MSKAFFYWLLFSSYSFGQIQQITFLMSVPNSTDHVYLIGNHKRLGNWNHSNAVKLKSVNDTLFTSTIIFPTNKNIEFKFTQGDWEKEALNENLSIPPNRTIKVENLDTIYYVISSWKDWRSFPMEQITGNMIIHKNVYSPQLDNKRTVLVWLPPSYNYNPSKRYPVLYLHDGKMYSPRDSHCPVKNGNWMKRFLI